MGRSFGGIEARQQPPGSAFADGAQQLRTIVGRVKDNRSSKTCSPPAVGRTAMHLLPRFDAYWEFHIKRGQRRLYPAWTVVPK